MTETLRMPLDDPAPYDDPAAAAIGVPAAAPHSRGWVRRTLDDTGYALLAFPLGLLSFVVVLVGTTLGVSLAWMVLGLPVLALTAFVARGFAHLERARLRGQLGRSAPSPVYLTAQRQDGWLRRTTTPLRDPQTWLDVVWSLLALVTGLAAWVVVVVVWAVVLNGATYWFWQQYLPDTPGQQGIAELVGLGDARSTEIALQTALGVVALLLVVPLTRLAAALHASLAEVMLCSRANLQAEVRRAAGGRDAAREAEATSLRRLERDLHDGPQQRLVRLAMDLGRARHQLDRDPERAREALDAAYVQARESLAELRALSRGIAPPLLVDRGLGPALEELVALSDARVDLRLDPDVVHGLAPHVETCVYFVVAEAMTNVAKHSRAHLVEVSVTGEEDRIVVQVADDGVGGAHPGKGSGLAGLERRVGGLDGTLAVTSPAGGPTVVRAEVPRGA